MTNHLRAISPLGKYVDIVKLSQIWKPRKSRSVQALNAQRPSGGQTQDRERFKDRLLASVLSTNSMRLRHHRRHDLLQSTAFVCLEGRVPAFWTSLRHCRHSRLNLV